MIRLPAVGSAFHRRPPIRGCPHPVIMLYFQLSKGHMNDTPYIRGKEAAGRGRTPGDSKSHWLILAYSALNAPISTIPSPAKHPFSCLLKIFDFVQSRPNRFNRTLVESRSISRRSHRRAGDRPLSGSVLRIGSRRMIANGSRLTDPMKREPSDARTEPLKSRRSNDRSRSFSPSLSSPIRASEIADFRFDASRKFFVLTAPRSPLTSTSPLFYRGETPFSGVENGGVEGQSKCPYPR